VSRAASRRGLVVVAALLLIILVIADALRPNSILRNLFGTAPANRHEEVLDGVRRRGIPVPDQQGLLVPSEGAAPTPSQPA